MKTSSFVVLLCASAAIASVASAQLTLSPSGYFQNFNQLGSGLPDGWSVHTGATATGFGTEAVFTSDATSWSNTSSIFRNIASFEGSSTSDNNTTQSNRSDRALGWRPIGVTASDTSARNGAVMLQLTNTLGFRDFELKVTLFTANNVGTTDQNYSLEYRVGDVGEFHSVGAYMTTNPFGDFEMTANAATLAALNDQIEAVYIRIRGTSTTGTGSLDTLGIDNFSLTYSPAASAIPEPSTYGAIAAGISLLGAIYYRGRSRNLPGRSTS
jgi:hypothetical protein